MSRPKPCTCGAYHYPHRRGGGACVHGPLAAYYVALRCGATVPQAEAELWAGKLELLQIPACQYVPGPL
jgi:hypothetical protein